VLARRFNPQKDASEKPLEMTATDDYPIASWQERVGTLRKRGRVGAAALTVVPAAELDVRVGRPPAPERLSAEERAGSGSRATPGRAQGDTADCSLCCFFRSPRTGPMVRLQEPIMSIVSQVELSVSAVYTGRVHRAVPSDKN